MHWKTTSGPEAQHRAAPGGSEVLKQGGEWHTGYLVESLETHMLLTALQSAGFFIKLSFRDNVGSRAVG